MSSTTGLDDLFSVGPKLQTDFKLAPSTHANLTSWCGRQGLPTLSVSYYATKLVFGVYTGTAPMSHSVLDAITTLDTLDNVVFIGSAGASVEVFVFCLVSDRTGSGLRELLCYSTRYWA